jgi:hypothetical protein
LSLHLAIAPLVVRVRVAVALGFGELRENLLLHGLVDMRIVEQPEHVHARDSGKRRRSSPKLAHVDFGRFGRVAIFGIGLRDGGAELAGDFGASGELQ